MFRYVQGLRIRHSNTQLHILLGTLYHVQALKSVDHLTIHTICTVFTETGACTYVHACYLSSSCLIMLDVQKDLAPEYFILPI